MFTVPPNTPGGPGFVDETSHLRAAWLNYVSNNFPKAVDGVGGGYYQLAGANLRFASNSRIVKFNLADPSFPLELRGYVTIGLTDEADYATGVGSLTVNVPATFTAGITYSGGITYSSTVTFNGAVTFGSGGDITLNSGCVLTAQSGSSIVVQSGAVLTNQGTFTTTTSLNFASAQSYSRGPKGIFAVEVSTAQWQLSMVGSTFLFAYEQGTDVTTGTPIVWIMNVPPGSTITGASIWVDPASGHGGTPGTVPSFALYTYDPTTATAGLVPSSATSDSGFVETSHQFSSAVLSTNVANGEVVLMEVRGEYGANALPGLKVYAPAITFTRTRIGEE